MFVKRIGHNVTHADGFVHKIISWIGEKCNFTQVSFLKNKSLNLNLRKFNMPLIFVLYGSFQYMLPPDEAYGSFENGSWNGMVGMLVRNVN